MTETIHLRGESGALLTASLPLHFSLQDRLDKGEIVRVNPDGSIWLAGPELAVQPQEPAEDEEPAPPKRTASQSDWAAYAVTQGMDPAAAAGMKRDDLYKAYRGTLRAVG